LTHFWWCSRIALLNATILLCYYLLTTNLPVCIGANATNFKKGKSVKKTLLLTLLLSACWQLQAQQVLHVTVNGSGNGTSWQQSISLLQALEVAQPGDQLWVAEGTYLPTHTSDRNASFVVKDGIQLFGGFNGTETSVAERDWKANLTILSGNIGENTPEDNVYTVIYTKNVSAETVVNGFVITNGFANGTRNTDATRCGAGWYNDGSNGASNPTIQNCLFANNYARDGAALYNFAKNGESSPTITNCQFLANRADLDGGAIFNNGSNGTSNPHIKRCLFKENEATYGAGIQNEGDFGTVSPTIEDCVFIANVSYIRGSSIYNNRPKGGVCNPVVKACRYENNLASVGKNVSGLSDTQINSDNTGKLVYVAGF
jgi:hypothetical protein